MIFISWNASCLLGNLEELYGWIWRTPLYIYIYIYVYITFSGNHYRLGEHMQLTSSHCENVVKTKIDISIFLNSLFYNHTKLAIMRTFPQGSIYFYVLCYYFEMNTIVLFHFESAFYHFCWYYYRHDVKVDGILFLFYMRSINRT